MEISHGSVVAHWRCGGIFNNDCIANLVVSLIVKEFENRSTFCEVSAESLMSWFLSLTVYIQNQLCVNEPLVLLLHSN